MVDAGGRICGNKRRQRNNFGPPWKESIGRIRGGGDLERASHIRIQREVGWKDGNSECWDGDRIFPGGRMTSCGRRRCWDGEGGRPGGRMNSCGSYGGD